MAVWDEKVVWGFVFLLAAAMGASVNYPDPICAVKGSTVTLYCTCTPNKSLNLDGRQVLIEIIRVRWCKNHLICQGDTPSVYDSTSINNRQRYKYLGDLKGNCTLQITDIQKEDDATFRFRMEANYYGGHFTGQRGVKVTVTDHPTMRIKSSSDDRELRQGENVTLFCTALCTFHQLEVTWFKDDHTLSESGPALQLGPLTAEDSGNYTCGLKSDPSTLSPPYSLHVEAEQEGITGDGAEEGGSNPFLMVGVVSGVLLALFILIMVLCIIRRKRAAAADKDQRAVSGEVEQKHPDNAYGNIPQPAEREGGAPRQETSRAAEEISYAAIRFKHKKKARPAEEAEEAIIYSAVAGSS